MQKLVTQVTAIVYVRPAEAGGKLLLWPFHYDHDEFMVCRNVAMYGMDYTKLPSPSMRIEPGEEELVLADSTKPHAVTKVERGTCIAADCFIGFRGVESPLAYWS